jgi:transcriptional regulator with XRE-family HTH domain
MNNTTENLGYRLKTLRENCGFTQSNIANFLNVDQSLISMAEKGKRALTSDMIDKLSALYGVQPIAFHESDTLVRHLTFALRANEILEEDLEVISSINRIALNSIFMTKLLEGGNTHG